MDQSVVVASGVRTAIGDFGGALAGVAPTDTAAAVSKEAIARAGIAPDAIGHAVFGNVIHTEPKDMYLSRVAAVGAGVPHDTPALTLNRLCGSGLQAVVSATQSIMLGDVEVALAGGAESMSRAPHSAQSARTGAKMGDVKFVDMMVGALTDPFGAGHMGVTAENVARERQISRADQDEMAAESHRRASRAIAEGRFTDQILPIEVKKKRDLVAFDTDEHVRGDVTAESLAGLRTVFMKEGTVTAGNASGINDGAAAVVLMREDAAKAHGATPLAKIRGYAHAGVDPSTMGLGPIPAVKKLCERTGLKVSDFDVVESNEAFAAQACAVARELGFDNEKLNPNGGAIALGHPIGATGAVLVVKTAYELKRAGGSLGLITMCIGGGQGIAMAIEAV